LMPLLLCATSSVSHFPKKIEGLMLFIASVSVVNPNFHLE
jgi:hypothetical protein